MDRQNAEDEVGGLQWVAENLEDMLEDILDEAQARAIDGEDEPDDVNPVRARVQREAADATAQGMSDEVAQRQASWRVFGPRPGGYGAGVQDLIDSGRWEGADDIAQAYLRAGAFAYGQDEHGAAARASFERRVCGLDVVLQNQDNHEHDILDSGDYYQFQGGMAAGFNTALAAAFGMAFACTSTPAAPPPPLG
jgi:cobaltochelatase CobN